MGNKGRFGQYIQTCYKTYLDTISSTSTNTTKSPNSSTNTTKLTHHDNTTTNTTIPPIRYLHLPKLVDVSVLCYLLNKDKPKLATALFQARPTDDNITLVNTYVDTLEQYLVDVGPGSVLFIEDHFRPRRPYQQSKLNRAMRGLFDKGRLSPIVAKHAGRPAYWFMQLVGKEFERRGVFGVQYCGDYTADQMILERARELGEVVVVSVDHDFLGLSADCSVVGVYNPKSKSWLSKSSVCKLLNLTPLKLFVAYCLSGCDDISVKIRGIGFKTAWDIVNELPDSIPDAKTLKAVLKSSSSTIGIVCHEMKVLHDEIWLGKEKRKLKQIESNSMKSLMEDYLEEVKDDGEYKRSGVVNRYHAYIERRVIPKQTPQPRKLIVFSYNPYNILADDHKQPLTNAITIAQGQKRKAEGDVVEVKKRPKKNTGSTQSRRQKVTPAPAEKKLKKLKTLATAASKVVLERWRSRVREILDLLEFATGEEKEQLKAKASQIIDDYFDGTPVRRIYDITKKDDQMQKQHNFGVYTVGRVSVLVDDELKQAGFCKYLKEAYGMYDKYENAMLLELNMELRRAFEDGEFEIDKLFTRFKLESKEKNLRYLIQQFFSSRMGTYTKCCFVNSATNGDLAIRVAKDMRVIALRSFGSLLAKYLFGVLVKKDNLLGPDHLLILASAMAQFLLQEGDCVEWKGNANFDENSEEDEEEERGKVKRTLPDIIQSHFRKISLSQETRNKLITYAKFSVDDLKKAYIQNDDKYLCSFLVNWHEEIKAGKLSPFWRLGFKLNSATYTQHLIPTPNSHTRYHSLNSTSLAYALTRFLKTLKPFPPSLSAKLSTHVQTISKVSEWTKHKDKLWEAVFPGVTKFVERHKQRLYFQHSGCTNGYAFHGLFSKLNTYRGTNGKFNSGYWKSRMINGKVSLGDLAGVRTTEKKQNFGNTGFTGMLNIDYAVRENEILLGDEEGRLLFEDRVVFSFDPGCKFWAGIVAMLGRFEGQEFEAKFSRFMLRQEQLHHQTHFHRKPAVSKVELEEISKSHSRFMDSGNFEKFKDSYMKTTQELFDDNHSDKVLKWKFELEKQTSKFWEGFKKKLIGLNEELLREAGIQSNKMPVIVFGNGSFKTPKGSKSGNYTKLKKYLSRFFLVIIVDEYNTSQKCPKCSKQVAEHNESSRVRVCSSCTSTSKSGTQHQFIVNRDISAPVNFIRIVLHLVLFGERPTAFKKCQNTTSGSLDSSKNIT